MAKLSEHQSRETTKMLFLGDPGSGKTGGLACLARAGWNLYILDFDNGADILYNVLKGDTEATARVDIETVTDSMKNVNGKLIPQAKAWTRAMTLLDKWNDAGGVMSWTSKDILVIDSLTTLGKAALAFQLSMNGRLGQQPTQQDWYQAQMLLESFLQRVYDENVKCNVIINCHVKFVGEDNGPQRGYPETGVGTALSPKIGLYFNSVIMAKTTGQGTNQKRKIFTSTTGIVELKNSSPTKVKPEYDQVTGLAEFFKDLRS